MQQIVQYRSGERDYTLMKGDTGPLVYPAGERITEQNRTTIGTELILLAHVYIYNGLYQITNEGTNIFRAQCIFGVLYLSALSMVIACYRKAQV